MIFFHYKTILGSDIDVVSLPQLPESELPESENLRYLKNFYQISIWKQLYSLPLGANCMKR